MHPAEMALSSVIPVNLIRLVPSEGKMHIWDSSRIALHLDGCNVIYFYFMEEILCPM